MRILSGARPTGKLHLGHLAGILSQWVTFQEEYECFFMLADWHALLSEYKNPVAIQENAFDNLADWLSWGISEKKATLFIQSQVPEHLELFFVFSSFVPLGLLFRCPTFKDQIQQLKDKELNTYGFLGYPVLQAADILIYNAERVPVGEDQLPHLELTREIARKFNYLYQRELFCVPQQILSSTPKLLGLDGRKMSKSYGNCIYLSDDNDSISEKVKTMFTDPERIKRTQPGRPSVCNVFSYYAIFFAAQKDVVYTECTQALRGCTDCKKQLAGLLIGLIEPCRKKREKILAEKGYLERILQGGCVRARSVAARTLQEVRKAIGL